MTGIDRGADIDRAITGNGAASDVWKKQYHSLRFVIVVCLDGKTLYAGDLLIGLDTPAQPGVMAGNSETNIFRQMGS